MDIFQKAIKITLLLVLVHIAAFLNTSMETKAEASGIIVITNMGFVPKTLTFSEGEVVLLVIHNQDDQVHRLVIPKLNLSSPYLMKGEMATLRFTPHESGSFLYHVTASKFGDNGYTGTLIIKKKSGL